MAIHKDFQEKVKQYAELAVKVGVNVQEDQPLWISAPLGTEDFVRLVVKEAYLAGARIVHVQWYDEEIMRMHYESAPHDVFYEYPSWLAAAHEWVVDLKGAFLQIEANDPDLLKGIDPDRILNYEKASGDALDRFYEAIEKDEISWSIVAIPSQKWADKVFPELPPSERVPSLWERIFTSVRIDRPDPVSAWKSHIQTLTDKATQLNALHLESLHYSAIGTDLSIELHEDHIWLTGASKTPQGTSFIANMPTEEVYTVPVKTGVNGTVTSTKPLAYNGNVIDGFTLTFVDGEIKEVSAEEGEEILRKLIDTDEGAAYLGEVALVPHQSPISDSGVLFFNTLFDENASNHLAIGSSYPTCMKDGNILSDEEREEKGLNESVVHEDFMIGSATMNIDGVCRDGKKIAIFRNGNWAI
ncbi:aminopeptidase [Rossellomorea vietnamensis]|uniref:aminopeptidase n=1 Tax=Rossellomorea vietnamensis TaxID=218284 RepID=UPI001CCD53F5|nr:aminopeptidase [Rossellomorea vietnamensis]MCA0148241.1 aminopeptidase [Rossellomorea vietnamensis]